MPDKPVSVHVPDVCAACGQRGTVRLQQQITGTTIRLEWHCSACHAEWPVTRKEQEPPPVR